jgi:hypothetical protein
MRYASAKSLGNESTFNNNLPTPTATLWLILEILKILIQTTGRCAPNFQQRWS